MVLPSTAAKLLSLFPQSPVVSVTSHSYSLAHGTLVPTTPSGPWAITAFDDSDIFAHQMVHSQLNASGVADAMRSWELRIGQSGQIYSLSTQGFETQPPQWRSTTPAANQSLGGGTQWAPWVDDVLQSVAVNGNLNTRLPDNVAGVLYGPWRIHDNTSEHSADVSTFRHQAGDYKYFMHSGGGYLRDNQSALNHNPLLAQYTDITEKSHSVMNWMIQAHAPSIFPGHCISMNRYKDIGGGFIEVCSFIYNFYTKAPVLDDIRSAGGYPGKLTSFNFPWGGVRETTYGKFYLANTSGSLVEQTMRQTFVSDPPRIPFADFGGWVCFSAGSNEGSRALAIVTGGDRDVTDYDPMGSGLLWGFVDVIAPTEPAQITTKRNFQLTSFVRLMGGDRLAPGTGIWARWYIGIGERSDLEATITANQLATEHATFGRTDFHEATSPVIPWYGTAVGPLSDTPPTSTTPPRIWTYAWPVNSSVPLFQIKSATNSYALTIDPYYFATSNADPVFGMRYYRSYDGQTAEWVLLGFVMTDSAVNQNGTLFPYETINTSLFSTPYYIAPSTLTLKVRMSLRIVNSGTNKWLFCPNTSTAAPSVKPTTNAGSNTRWQLIPSPVEDDYYIENLVSSRRIVATSATTLGQADATETGTNARWRLASISGGIQLINVAQNKALASVSTGSEALTLVTPGTTAPLSNWSFLNTL